MPQARTAAQFEALYRERFGSGALRGTSDVGRLPQVGSYFQGRLHGMGTRTVHELTAYLAGRASAAGVFDALSRVLQNRRAGQVVAFPTSPLVARRDEGVSVAFDFNFLTYTSMRALLRVVAAAPAATVARWGLGAGVPAHMVPPALPPVSTSGKYCAAHHNNRRLCQRAANHCRWVVGGAGATNCVPRNSHTRSCQGVGTRVLHSARAFSAAPRRAQPPLISDPAVHPPAPPIFRGRYVHDWRRPPGGALPAMPYP